MYFLHQIFISGVSEIPISSPFPELPFSILFPIKNMKNGNGFSVYRSFPTVFIPTDPGVTALLQLKESLFPIPGT
jgi:hypothetical protein